MSGADYINSSQQSLITLITALARDPLTPKSVAFLQKALMELSKDQIFRGLKNLEHAGWAHQIGEGWRLAPAFTQLADAVRQNIAEIIKQYTAGNKEGV